jgi:hypothetical protein
VSPLLVWILISVSTSPFTYRFMVSDDGKANKVTGSFLFGGLALALGCSFGGVGVGCLIVSFVQRIQAWKRKQPKSSAHMEARQVMYAKIYNRLGGFK